MIRAHLVVIGMVQGVGFRFSAQQRAREIGVVGWVKNLNDGSVEIEVEGTEEKVNQFIAVMKQGPSRFITVDNVQVTTSENLKGYTDFDIKM